MTTLQKDNGGRAFPILHTIDGNWVQEPLEQYSGMSLRDWFAGMALQTLLDKGGDYYDCTAKCAYRAADAMLEARKL